MEEFTTVIKSEKKFFELNLKEVFMYIDLIKMQVYRNIIITYKQTILGPLWMVLNPLLTTFVYTFLFGNIAQISTDNIPQLLFYMSGNALWSLFSTVIVGTSSTFIDNAAIFSKVYFPRMVVPISTAITSFANFSLQLLMFFAFYIYYLIIGSDIHITCMIWILPIVFIQVLLLAVGGGIIISALTTKYRDLKIVITFGIQLWMYITPVVYPLSSVKGKLQFLMMLNPMSTSCEVFRYALLGNGVIYWPACIYSVIISLAVFLYGVCLFNKVERISMDTV